MTLPTTVEPLPASYSFGKVVGRVIHLIADTAEDTDDRPEARPAAGKVRFTPDKTLVKTVEADYPAIVLSSSVVATLNEDGYIQDAEGNPSIWLAVGVYTVQFEITGAPGSVEPFAIAVTSDHTDAAPLDLAAVVPYVPPTGVTVQTIVIPAGGTDGQMLVRTADGGLRWQTVLLADGSNLDIDSADLSDASALGRAVLTAVDEAAARAAIGAASQADVDEAIGAIDTTVESTDITDASAVGRALVTAVDEAAARAAIGAASQADVDEAIGAIDPTVEADEITDASATGRAVLTAPDQATARAAIGAGTSSLGLGTTSDTAKAGDWKPTAADVSDATTTGRNVMKASNQAAARSAIGAGRVDSSDGTILNIVKLTQAQYNALGTKVVTTLYVIQG